ncbi:MAG: hypothetical protein AAF689_11670 [Pseudomonadota bacterium]
MKNQFNRLAKIVEIKADKARSELASATKSRNEIRRQIDELQAEIKARMATAEDPLTARLVAKYAEVVRERQARLVADLAQANARRKAALHQAQATEGRRIAIDTLKRQAS